MKCLSCAFATEEDPFHSAAFHPLRPPREAKGRRLDDGALFRSEGHLFRVAGRWDL